MKGKKFEFTGENLRKYEEILTRYDDIRSALLPVLHLAQDQHGYLPVEVLEKISEMMSLPLIDIKEVVSFYDMFYAEPTAKNIIQVCTNITCSMFGGREIHQGLLKNFNTENMKPTKDGKYFFQKMECLGACSEAPCMRVNNDYFGPITLESATQVLEEID